MTNKKTPKWTDETICQKLREITAYMETPYMPTHKEMNAFMNSHALSNAVARNGGTVKFARLLNLKVKDCESKFGDIFEQKCIEDIYAHTHLKSEKMMPRYPYDLLVDKCVKVDSKVGRLYYTPANFCFYTFNLEKKNPTCDIYVCYCIDDEQRISKEYIIPSVAIHGITQLSIGKHSSKYDKYIDRWDLVQSYVDFYKAKLN